INRESTKVRKHERAVVIAQARPVSEVLFFVLSSLRAFVMKDCTKMRGRWFGDAAIRVGHEAGTDRSRRPSGLKLNLNPAEEGPPRREVKGSMTPWCICLSTSDDTRRGVRPVLGLVSLPSVRPRSRHS